MHVQVTGREKQWRKGLAFFKIDTKFLSYAQFTGPGSHFLLGIHHCINPFLRFTILS